MEGVVLEAKPVNPNSLAADAEIARLRERLAFYEHFDQLIRDNISNSGALLREAASTQEEASRALARASSREQTVRIAERAQFRSLFSTMFDEVTILQGQLERLARRVADTLDDLESDAPAGHVHPPRAAALPSGDEAATPPEPETNEPIAPGVTSEDFDASSPPGNEPNEVDEGIEPFSPEKFADEIVQIEEIEATPPASEPSTPEEFVDSLPFDDPAAFEETTPDADQGVAAAPLNPVKATLLVHGMPKASIALSMKLHLEELPEFTSVDVREYAEMVLRMVVVGTRSITVEDLQSWAKDAVIEPIHVRPDLLEVRYSRP